VAKRRVLVAQGPTQLIAALTVWEHQANARVGPCEDTLLLGDFHADEAGIRRIETVSRQIAGVWDFAHIASTHESDALFYDGHLSLEDYSARIAESIGTTHVDEVYVCRNMQLLNETVLNLFEGARKVCYGDGFGYIDLNGTEWCKPLHPNGYVPVDEIACLMPFEYSEGVWENLPLTIVAPGHFTTLMQRIALLADSVQESASQIGRTARDRLVLISTCHLLQNGLVASVEDEISLYIECALPFLDRDTTVVVKGHPREKAGQARMLAEWLRALGHDARDLADLKAMPLECYATMLRVAHFLPLFSSAAPGWRLLQPETTLQIGVPDSAIDRYMLPAVRGGWFHVESIAPTSFALAAMATVGRFRPISLRAVNESLALAPPAPIRLEGIAEGVTQPNWEHTPFLQSVLVRSSRHSSGFQ
jgi:hypothetical protein